MEAFSKIEKKDSQRAIVLISDGVNTYGEVKLKEVINSALKTQTQIYAIGIGDEFYDGVDKKTLEKITEATNGVAIVPKKKLSNLPQQLENLKSNFRSSYEFIFTTSVPDSEKTKLQEIEIEIVNSDLRKQKLKVLQPKGFVLSN